MNQDQFLGMLRVVASAVIPLAVTYGYIDPGVVPNVITTIVTLGAIGWSWVAHTDKSKLIAAAAVPDVKKIITAVNPASDAVKQLAADTDHPKITDMVTPLK